MKIVLLKPIKETTEDYDRLEAKLIDWFRREIYIPMMRELGEPTKRLENALPSPLVRAVRDGRITFSRGSFKGRFDSEISKELRSLGASWDRKTRTYKIPASSLPPEVATAISASEAWFLTRLGTIDRKLAQILPEELAEKLFVSKIFDSSLWKVDEEFHKTVRNLTVAPELTPERRKIIADEWQTNMRLWIKDFTEKEIKTLRGNLQESVFAGNRYESAVKTIQKSYGVSQSKAKFLARQETALLMAKFKEIRYVEAGVDEYKWGCVKMPHDKTPGEHVRGNVRYSHGMLDGTIQRWDSPPITSNPGETVRRNNPQQDYNCRCFALPIVRFKK